MTITRRELMRRASALGIVGLATPTLVNCGKDDGEGTDSGTTGDASESESTTSGEDDGLPKYEFDGEPGPENLFSHGVASGDPLADSVILSGCEVGRGAHLRRVLMDKACSIEVSASQACSTPPWARPPAGPRCSAHFPSWTPTCSASSAPS